MDNPEITPATTVHVAAEAIPPQPSQDEVKLTKLRYLVLAGEEWPEDDEECEFFAEKLGWETAKACYAAYDDAIAKALTYAEPEWWWQVVDLYTMSVIFKSYDTCTALH